VSQGEKTMDERELKVEYVPECDLLTVLQETVDPKETVNMEHIYEPHWIVRYTTVPNSFEAAGFFITAASLHLPKVVKALSLPKHIEVIKETFQDALKRENEYIKKVIEEAVQKTMQDLSEQKKKFESAPRPSLNGGLARLEAEVA